MKRSEFISDPNVLNLTKFIANKWNNGLDFNLVLYKKGQQNTIIKISSLKDAYEKYFWESTINTSIKMPDKIKLDCGNFIDSLYLLNFAKSKMLTSGNNLSNEKDIKEATEIVFKWGGVYKKGNKDKVEGDFNFKENYQRAIDIWKEILNEKMDIKPIKNIPCNAAFTKVYSLILDSFIIYDSRVATALAYLINKCFNNKIPYCLKLFIPSSNIKEKDKRKVNEFFKPTYQDSSKHFYSNIKASLILSESIKEINRYDSSVKLEQLGSALFMIGYDIRNKNM